MPGCEGLPNWRDAGAYEPLLHAERATFAWEWVRRQPSYRAEALRARAAQHELPLGIIAESPGAANWGLHAFEDPRLAAPHARPIWRSERHPFVLGAFAEAWRADPNALELGRLGATATILAAEGVERLLLTDGYRSVRLDARGTSLLSGSVRLHYDLAGVQAARRMIPVLQRFIAVVSNGAFLRSPHPPDRRARRQVLLLRTHDALQDGADQRTIAAELLSGTAANVRWRIESPSVRSQAQRLVHGARSMAAGRFWQLLR